MSYMRLVSIDPVNKIIVCGDFITSYFNKCLEEMSISNAMSRGIKVQDKILTKVEFKAKYKRWGSI